MLVVPKKHYLDIEDIDEGVLRHINEITKNMYKLLKDKLKADGLTIIQNNGYGQEIKHYHVHLTPRYNDDQIGYTYPKDKIDIKNIYEILIK